MHHSVHDLTMAACSTLPALPSADVPAPRLLFNKQMLLHLRADGHDRVPRKMEVRIFSDVRRVIGLEKVGRLAGGWWWVSGMKAEVHLLICCASRDQGSEVACNRRRRSQCLFS